MSVDVVAVVVAVVGGVVANVGVLVAFRVSIEHRLTRLETTLQLHPRAD